MTGKSFDDTNDFKIIVHVHVYLRAYLHTSELWEREGRGKEERRGAREERKGGERGWKGERGGKGGE